MSSMEGRDMSDRLRSVEIGLATLGATLGTKLDALTAAVSTQHTDHEARMRVQESAEAVDPTHEPRIAALEQAVDPTHEPRIAKLERALYLVAGGAIVLGGGAGSIVSAVLP